MSTTWSVGGHCIYTCHRVFMTAHPRSLSACFHWLRSCWSSSTQSHIITPPQSPSMISLVTTDANPLSPFTSLHSVFHGIAIRSVAFDALPIQNAASINFFNPSVGSNQTKIDQANQTKCSNYIRIASVQLTKMESTHRHHHKHGNATDDNQNTSS